MSVLAARVIIIYIMCLGFQWQDLHMGLLCTRTICGYLLVMMAMQGIIDFYSDIHRNSHYGSTQLIVIHRNSLQSIAAHRNSS